MSDGWFILCFSLSVDSCFPPTDPWWNIYSHIHHIRQPNTGGVLLASLLIQHAPPMMNGPAPSPHIVDLTKLSDPEVGNCFYPWHEGKNVTLYDHDVRRQGKSETLHWRVYTHQLIGHIHTYISLIDNINCFYTLLRWHPSIWCVAWALFYASTRYINHIVSYNRVCGVCLGIVSILFCQYSRILFASVMCFIQECGFSVGGGVFFLYECYLSVTRVSAGVFVFQGEMEVDRMLFFLFHQCNLRLGRVFTDKGRFPEIMFDVSVWMECLILFHPFIIQVCLFGAECIFLTSAILFISIIGVWNILCGLQLTSIREIIER